MRGSTLQRYRRALGFCPRKQHVKVKSAQSQVEQWHTSTLQHRNSNIKNWIFIDETQVYFRSTGTIIGIRRGEPTTIHDIYSLRVYANLRSAI